MTGEKPPVGPGAALGRKDEHLDIVLSGLAARRLPSGFDAVRFEHSAAPELDLAAVELTATFLYATPGAEGLRQALKHLKGEKVEKTITLPTEKVTAENAAQILKDKGM